MRKTLQYEKLGRSKRNEVGSSSSLFSLSKVRSSLSEPQKF